ncbi:MAG: GtrA family protein [Gammaproteobacteria bacterium]|nr:GtrA family protein [Gammaproteobacteria bacterium]
MSTPVQMLRFAVVGLASNAVLYMVYLGMTAVALGPKLAMSLVYAIGVAQTFLFNKRWTFNHAGRHDTAFIRYVTVYAGGYLINLLVLVWLVDSLGYPHQIVQGLMILVLAGCFFVLQKIWVFKVSEA